jgi:RecB family endonuclease NucS
VDRKPLREYPTDIGPVDLLCRDADGSYVAVEIKRRGEIDGVEQLTRYLSRLRGQLGEVWGILAAQDFRPQAKVLAGERGIDCVRVDYDELRGIESNVQRLF